MSSFVFKKRLMQNSRELGETATLPPPHPPPPHHSAHMPQKWGKGVVIVLKLSHN